jgi:hypothetical protein
MITHSVSWALAEGGWITRCGCFADTTERLSEDPTCLECRCWLGTCGQGCTTTCLRKAGALIDGSECAT